MDATGTAIDPFAVWAVSLVAVAGGIALVWRVLRGIRRVFKAIDDFMADWHGVPERAGYPERPGVMARLSRIEHELNANSGESLRDAVNRIEQKVDTVTRP